jgi:hypothetical protein
MGMKLVLRPGLDFEDPEAKIFHGFTFRIPKGTYLHSHQNRVFDF